MIVEHRSSCFHDCSEVAQKCSDLRGVIRNLCKASSMCCLKVQREQTCMFIAIERLQRERWSSMLHLARDQHMPILKVHMSDGWSVKLSESVPIALPGGKYRQRERRTTTEYLLQIELLKPALQMVSCRRLFNHTLRPCSSTNHVGALLKKA